MKKVSILLLLATVLTAFSFAQVTVLGGFEANNLTGGNEGVLDPALWTEFYGAASEELGPGAIGAELGLGAKLHFSDEAIKNGVTAVPYDSAGDIYLKGSYTLPAGPGELAIGISTWPLFSALSFGLDYDGIAAGPVVIGLGLGYDFNTTGRDDDGKIAIFGDGPIAAADTFTARLSADFDFGLGIVYKFKYDIGEENAVSKIVYLDVTYQVIDPLVVGLELDDTGEEFKGFTLKPYANYSITEKTTAGLFVKIANISGESPADDIIFTPGLTIKHVF
jgi:hypothetical protein